MGGWSLVRLRLAAGLWEGRLTGPAGAAPPEMCATWDGGGIAAVQIDPDGDGHWTVRFRLPPEILSDGVRTLAIGPPDGDPLWLESVAFGDPLEAGLRAELAALRTEFEVLKRAVRRHLADGG